MLYANPKYFSTWAHGSNAKGNGRSRHDYDCTEHLIAEMLTEDYWGTLAVDLAPGDLVWITDATTEQAVIRIDWVDIATRRVGLSVQERITEHAVVGAGDFAIKNRGPRGGFWCVIDANGDIVKRDIRTRDEAERARNVLRDTRTAA